MIDRLRYTVFRKAQGKAICNWDFDDIDKILFSHQNRKGYTIACIVE